VFNHHPPLELPLGNSSKILGFSLPGLYSFYQLWSLFLRALSFARFWLTSLTLYAKVCLGNGF